MKCCIVDTGFVEWIEGLRKSSAIQIDVREDSDTTSDIEVYFPQVRVVSETSESTIEFVFLLNLC